MKMRRIVTGHTREGKATFISDTTLEGDTNRVWGADQVSVFPDNGAEPNAPRFFPPVGGFRLVYVTLAPESESDPELSESDEEVPEEAYGYVGLKDHMEPDEPGMHTSDTIDFVYIISGEIWLELDDNEERLIKAGDTVVENGTRHRWHNRSTEPCVMLGCMIGAERK